MQHMVDNQETNFLPISPITVHKKFFFNYVGLKDVKNIRPYTGF